MKIELHTKNCSLTEHQREYVNKKLDKINSMWRVMKSDTSVIKATFEHLEVKDKQHNMSCHIVINLPKKDLVVDVLWQSIEEAIDIAEDKVLAELSKYKWKYHEKFVRNKKGTSFHDVMDEEDV